MKLRLMRQMLAAAEADLEPARVRHPRQGIGKIDPQLRQQFIHQRGMMTAQGFALAPSIKVVLPVGLGHVTADFT